MKKRGLIVSYELIRVHTIPHMTLGIQNKSNLWCWKKGGIAALTRGSGKIERRPNSPPPYFEVVSLVVFFCLFYMLMKVRGRERKIRSKVLILMSFLSIAKKLKKTIKGGYNEEIIFFSHVDWTVFGWIVNGF